MLGISAYMLVFRIVHIGAAVAWAGSVFMLVVFVQPSAAAVAPASAPFMAELLGVRRLVDRLLMLGSIAIAGGLFLYWHDWHTYPSFGDWIASRFGAVLTIGALFAIAALSIGGSITKPAVERLLALGRQAADSGGPSPDMATKIGALQARLKTVARVQLGLIAVAVLAMATARYW
jgi:uncharacterized membrane protein